MRSALLLFLSLSEAMVDNRSYDILDVEEVDERVRVRAPFQFSALLYPKPFHHKNIRYYNASKKTRNISQSSRRCANLAQLNAPSCWTHRRRT